MKRSISYGILLIVIIAIGLVFYTLYFNSNRSISQEINPAFSESTSEVTFPVQTTFAHKANLVKSLQTNGTLRAKREVEIISRVGGEITRVTVNNGMYIHAGEELVKLDDREFRLTYEKTSNALLGAQIDYKTFSSSSAITEVDSSFIKKTVSEMKTRLILLEDKLRTNEIEIKDYLRLKRDYETELAYATVHRGDVMASKSGLSQAREAYERAKLDFEATTIKAPFDGFIANCDLEEGMRFQAGKELFSVIDVSSLLVDVEVLETEIANVKVGGKAEISMNAFPNEVFYGTVIAINPIVDAKSKTIKVTVELKDGRPDRWMKLKLRPGMFATVNLETEILPNRLLVRKEALLTRDQRNLIFVVEGNIAKWCYVEVGEENDQYIEIKSGIKEDDAVIVKGHYTLAHDAKVRVEK